MAVQSSTPIPLSYTVKTTLAAFPDATPVTAWMLARGAMSFHDDYGNYLAKRLVGEAGPGGGMSKPASIWLEEVNALFDPAQVTELHGRLFILGLCELDAELARFLDSFGFRDALKREIQEPYESLLRFDSNILQSTEPLPKAQPPSEAKNIPPAPPPTSPDYIIFRADAATDADQLGRAGFADALATWFSRIWGENYTSYVSQLKLAYKNETPLPQSSSFIVHLHGPWGAGKTSLLRLMEKALRNSRLNIGGKPHSWTVVWFNAWRNRQIEPVWWPPMDRVYREMVKSPSTDLGFWAWETWWRLRINGLGENPVVIGMAGLTLFGLFFLLAGNGFSGGSLLGSLSNWIGGISTFIGLAGTLGSGILTLSQSLFTASSAQNFTRLAQDPMEKVRTHFRQMMDRVNHPVMVFIDDLDRCQPEYVVRLLESLQTLFNDPRVFYVIAADRRWLYECFEIVYKDFKTTVREPGRRTGYLFLEKIFQMSISVPAMSEDTQKAYLDTLYRGERHQAEQKIAHAAQQAEADFAQVNTTEALIEQLQTPQRDPDPLVQQARREAAVRRLASQEVSADIEHFLQPFAPLLERNPRAMKRLVNAYSVYLALAMLADVELINNETKKKRFALWTILSLRWPALAEKLEKDPDALPAMLEKKPDGLDPELAQLVLDDEVQRVLHGEAKGVGVALDPETIMRLWGLQANTSNPVVA
ncbi:MAG: hypothetical protein Fur0022_38030 [Anaerolineales bacterium]